MISERLSVKFTGKNHGRSCFRAFVVLAFLTVISSVLYATYTQGLWRWNVLSVVDYPVRGIDVSHHQGVIDWAAVPKDQVRFVYIKASEGGDFQDPAFAVNWNGARVQGFDVGAYHFFTLCRDGAAQAENFIKTVPKAGKSLPPAIDLEFVGNCAARPSGPEFIQRLDAFVKTVETHFGQKPVLYSTPAFYERWSQEIGQFAKVESYR